MEGYENGMGATTSSPHPLFLQPLAVVTERIAASAATAVVAFDVVTFRTPVVIVMDTRAGLGRMICCYFSHDNGSFDLLISEGYKRSREAEH